MSAVLFDLNQFDVASHLDRGIHLMKLNLFTEAIVQFEHVLKIDPLDRYARWNRVLARLCLGDYLNGLPEHDCAWQVFGHRHYVEGKENALKLPLWRGRRCRVLAYHEMGLGDAILTLRFLPEFVSRCKSLTLVVKPELVSLMEGHGATVIDRVPDDLSRFDERVAFFNSIFTMGHSKETIPSWPYIKADFKFTGGRMGVCWTGVSRQDFSVNSFFSRVDVRDAEVYSLQKAPISEDRAFPLQCSTFKETAELMATLDRIVTVDTAVANLAGAMGHPNTHVILPFNCDWRWWQYRVWYPTLHIHRQETPNDWSLPFRQINEAS